MRNFRHAKTSRAEWNMTEKTEWEIVDVEPHPQTRPGMQQMLRASLGRWWRWKLAGGLIVASALLVLVVMLTGVALLAFATIAIGAICIGKLKRWLRHENGNNYDNPHDIMRRY